MTDEPTTGDPTPLSAEEEQRERVHQNLARRWLERDDVREAVSDWLTNVYADDVPPVADLFDRIAIDRPLDAERKARPVPAVAVYTDSNRGDGPLAPGAIPSHYDAVPAGDERLRVHNHPVACREILFGGRMVGECMAAAPTPALDIEVLFDAVSSDPERRCERASSFRRPCDEVVPVLRHPTDWCRVCTVRVRLAREYAATPEADPAPDSLAGIDPDENGDGVVSRLFAEADPTPTCAACQRGDRDTHTQHLAKGTNRADPTPTEEPR